MTALKLPVDLINAMKRRQAVWKLEMVRMRWFESTEWAAVLVLTISYILADRKLSGSTLPRYSILLCNRYAGHPHAVPATAYIRQLDAFLPGIATLVGSYQP